MKVEAYRFQHEPFGEVTPIPYRGRFSRADYERITAGLMPAAMEDKWFIYFVAPSLFLHRSWTGKAVDRVDFDVDETGARVREAVCASDVLVSQNADDQARLLGFLISNLLLKRGEPFPLPRNPAVGPPGLYQHHIAGTGYPEERPPQPSPWWKFWAR